MNFKAMFLLSVLVFGMGLAHADRVAAANTFSGFVDDSGTYTVICNIFPQWTVEEYDIMGKRIVNSPWMSKHKEVGLLTKTNGDKVLFRYSEYTNALIIGNFRSVSLDLSIYGYHGGELAVKPVIDGDNYAENFNVFMNGNLITTIYAKADEHSYEDLYLP